MSGPGKTIGIVAGGGSLPVEVAQSIVARGGAVHIIMVEGAASEPLAAFPHTRVHWAKLGRALKALAAAGARDIVLLGTFLRPEIKTARPDFAFVRSLPSVIKLLGAGGDDALLRGLIGVFEKHGLTVRAVSEVAPDLIAGQGSLTRSTPRIEDRTDIDKGMKLIAALGHHDIGQAVVIAGGRVVAIEGAEGTDNMLVRAALAPQSSPEIRNGVLVKRPKPGQDLRIDLPAIGPSTVVNAVRAQLAGIAVMADNVLVAERDATLEAADASGLFIEGVVHVSTQGYGRLSIRTPFRPVLYGSVGLAWPVEQDIRRGSLILKDCRSMADGSAVIVRNKRVFAVGVSERPVDVLSRARAYLKVKRKRSGAIVVTHVDEALIDAAASAGLGAIAIVYATGEPPSLTRILIARADEAGVALAAARLDRDVAQT